MAAQIFEVPKKSDGAPPPPPPPPAHQLFGTCATFIGCQRTGLAYLTPNPHPMLAALSNSRCTRDIKISRPRSRIVFKTSISDIFFQSKKKNSRILGLKFEILLGRLIRLELGHLDSLKLLANANDFQRGWTPFGMNLIWYFNQENSFWGELGFVATLSP